MAKLVLWLMNDVIEWDTAPLIKALSVQSAFTANHRHEVSVRTRRSVTVRGAAADADNARPGKPAELALEGAQWGHLLERDEYFVPIPVKCFGDPGNWANVAGFAPIRARYQRWFDAWSSWWSVAMADVFPFQVGMNTKKGVGYYDVLSAVADTGARNVLVGYSMAGLTARYLAYIDEHVAKKNAIAGVITAHTPNFGSPVAAPRNADAVLDAVGRALLSLGGLTDPPFSATHAFLIKTVIASSGISVDVVCGLLEAAVKDLLAMGPAAEHYRAQGELVVTGLKWLSGLRGGGLREKFAFFDFAPDLLDVDGAVLNAVTRFPSTRPSGAVIGANGKLEDLVLGGLPLLLRDPLRAFDGPLRAALAAASDCYARAMVDGPSTSATATRKAQEFLHGVANPVIAARAHDFIVPSAYQMIEGATLGNVVNADANHLTGYKGNDPRPPTDQQIVEAMLQKMGEAIPA